MENLDGWWIDPPRERNGSCDNCGSELDDDGCCGRCHKADRELDEDWGR